MPDTKSRQPRASQTRDMVPFIWTLWETRAGDTPAWGELSRLTDRSQKLREYGREEPILAGALASMISKVVSLDWRISGGRNRVRRYHELLSEAEDGKGWSYFVDRWAQDYLGVDVGGVVELAREGKAGPVVACYNLDAARVALTGNADIPLRYAPANGGKAIPFYPLDFARTVDMPSSDEAMLGLGFCAVSRALKAARMLLALYRYEEERLSDMPPQGIAAITGMTVPEVNAAFDLYDAKRKERQETTFKGVLWLASQSNPMQPIDVKLTPFSNLPEHFDRQQAVTQYVYTLSLDFGVDVREFWPASQVGATKAEAEIQAEKAKGKGFGRLISSLEREINWNVLPDSLEFLFDLKDTQDDLVRENVRALSIGNVRRLWEPNQASGEGIITTDEARRMLVEAEMVPEWMAATDESVAYGSENAIDTEAETDIPLPSTSVPVAAKSIARLAEKAQLGRNEDLVSVSRSGDVTVLRSTRYYSIPNWPRSEVPTASLPFGLWQ